MTQPRFFLAAAASLAAVIILSPGCTKPDLESPKAYDSDRIKFTYPGNWSITEEKRDREGETEFIYMAVEGGGDALMLVTHFRPPVPTTVEGYAAQIDQGRSEEVAKLFSLGGAELAATTKTRTSQTSAEVAGKKRQGVRQDFSIRLLSETVPHRATFFRIADDTGTTFLAAQSPTDTWDEVQPGFVAVQTSFAHVGGTPAPPAPAQPTPATPAPKPRD